MYGEGVLSARVGGSGSVLRDPATPAIALAACLGAIFASFPASVATEAGATESPHLSPDVFQARGSDVTRLIRLSAPASDTTVAPPGCFPGSAKGVHPAQMFYTRVEGPRST